MIGTWDERQVTGEKPYKPSQPCFNLSAWAIRQKSTGAFLPARKNGRGFSFDEPSFGFPRLFKSNKLLILRFMLGSKGSGKDNTIRERLMVGREMWNI